MISRLRTALFWAHLAVGVVAGLFIFNMALSGISIAYAKQITAWAERSQRVVGVPEGAAPLPVESLVAKVEQEQPQAHLSGVVRYADPAAAVMFYVGRDNNVLYADPYTGAVLGEGAKSVRAFFQFMTAWHRWLALEGTARLVGEAISGTVSIVYFAMLISGLILWLPARWSRKRVRQGAVLDLKLRGKARDWNWHNVIGLWFAPFLLLVTLTAIVMSHNWTTDLLYRLTGNPVPEHRQNGRGGRGDGPAAPDVDGLNALWAQAEKKVPGWHSISLRFAGNPDAPVSFLIDAGNGDRPDTVSTLALDRDSGDVVRWQPYAAQNAGQKLRAWMRPLHTGEAGGVLGQSLSVLTALGTITLVYTGFALAFRRFFPKRKPVPEFIPEPTPTSLVS